MDFRYTEDQLVLAEGVRDYLAGTHGPEVLRRLDATSNRDPAIWQGLVDMGLPGLLVPEEQGGMGLGLVDAIPIALECGRACLAEPLVDTAFVEVPWLKRQGDTAALYAKKARLDDKISKLTAARQAAVIERDTVISQIKTASKLMRGKKGGGNNRAADTPTTPPATTPTTTRPKTTKKTKQ